LNLPGWRVRIKRVCLKWQIVDYLMVLAVQWPLLMTAIEHTSVQKLRGFVLDAGLVHGFYHHQYQDY
jgi:hypothetical protein